jgi:hypothetical protein
MSLAAAFICQQRQTCNLSLLEQQVILMARYVLPRARSAIVPPKRRSQDVSLFFQRQIGVPSVNGSSRPAQDHGRLDREIETTPMPGWCCFKRLKLDQTPQCTESIETSLWVAICHKAAAEWSIIAMAEPISTSVTLF